MPGMDEIARRQLPIVQELLGGFRAVVVDGPRHTATPTASHARRLAALRDRLGERFRLGVVLHTGATVTGLGDRLIALPSSRPLERLTDVLRAPQQEYTGRLLADTPQVHLAP